MTTLEEAIENERELLEGCMENARRIKDNLNLAISPHNDELFYAFLENAEEHEQMVTWLEELKAYRENEFSDKAYQRGRIDAAEFILKMAHTDNITMCSEVAKELSQIKNCCSKWIKDHDKQIRNEVIEEIHKMLVEEIKTNPNVIYIDNQDYCCVARGSVLRVIRDALEQMKEGAEMEETKTDLPEGGEEMHIPATFEEFVNGYSFKDSDEIYTNGCDLIPTFRVMQAYERFVKEERIKFAKWLTTNHPVYDEWGNVIPAHVLIDKFSSQ